MGIPFLKASNIDINGSKIEFRQLSGLERFDFLDYVSTLKYPDQLAEPEKDASKVELEQYMNDMHRVMRDISKTTFKGQARLVAYAIVHDDVTELNIDERHQYVMSSFSVEDVKALHDAIAVLSGMPLPDQEQSDESASDVEQADKEVAHNPKA